MTVDLCLGDVVVVGVEVFHGKLACPAATHREVFSKKGGDPKEY
jgi:hypothetical protein